jgi:PBP1b-binding outer membrane lipoprotein LpoB
MRISFIDQSYTKEALSEIEKGMSGIIDPNSAIPVGALKSPNFYLYGDIRENVRYVSGKKLQYLVVTIKLKMLATGEQKWTDRQEFLKATKADRISF